MKKWLLSFTVAILFACNLQLVQAQEIPQPLEGFYVSDYANVINSSVKQEITEINTELEQLNGSQIVVATFDFLGGEDIVDYSADLFNEWGIGSAESNNGVLLVLALGEEDYYCTVGSGLENSLTSSVLDNLLYDNLEADFAAGTYSDGVMKTVRALAEKVKVTTGSAITYPLPDVKGNNTTRPTHKPSSSLSTYSIVQISIGVIGLIFVFAVASMLLGRGRRGYSRGYYSPRRPYYGGSTYEEDRLRRQRNRARAEVYHLERDRERHEQQHHSSGGMFGGGFSSSSSSSTRSSSGAGRRTSSSVSKGIGRGGGGSTRGGGAGRRKS